VTVIRVIDFETTGIPSEADKHAICEIGWCDVTMDSGGAVAIGDPSSTLVDPGRPISVEAMAVHHIRDAEVAGKRPAVEVLAGLCHGTDVFVAHKADFEQSFFDGLGRPFVCSYKSALRVWPDAPTHSNQVLRYWLGIELDPALALPAHRAGPDAYVTAHILSALLARCSLEDMIRWSAGPALLVTCYLKKHRGVKWKDVPADYLRWVAENITDDRDIRATAKYWLRAATSGAAP